MTDILSVKTLAICYGIFCCAQFIAFYLQHKISAQEKGPGWWTIGSGFAVLGFFTFLSRDIFYTHLLAVFIYNLTFILFFTFIYVGCSKFNTVGIKKAPLYLTTSLATLFLLYFTYIEYSISMRRTVTSLACSILSILLATTLRTERPRKRNIIMDFLKYLFTFNALLFSALALLPLVAKPTSVLLEQPSPLILSFLILITTSTLWTFGLIILVNQKLSNQLQTSKLFLQSTLDGLSANIALIEEHGEIILTNKAWRDFASSNGTTPDRVSEGVNYLTTCENTPASCNGDAVAFSEGIRRVMNGEISLYTMEYACHSADKQRWFLARITRFPCEGPARAVIAHEDITERKIMEIALEESNKQLEAITNEDGLTKISNRRHFDRMLSYECSRHSRTGTTMSIAMLDIDYFKDFNDTYGHVKGDECLQRVAQAISQSLKRPTDLAARFGGEVFVCLLPDTTLLGAVGISENIRKAILNLAIPHDGSKVSRTVTVSIGTLSITCTKDTRPEQIVQKADELLYQAKREGRNRIKFESINEPYRLEHMSSSTGSFNIIFCDTYTSNNPTIDAQHAHLVSLANELLQHIFAKSTTQEIQSLLNDVYENIARHFQDEEEILRAANYPEIESHVAEHARLMERYAHLMRRDSTTSPPTMDILQYVIHDIIMEHMIHEDVKYHYLFN